MSPVVALNGFDGGLHCFSFVEVPVLDWLRFPEYRIKYCWGYWALNARSQWCVKRYLRRKHPSENYIVSSEEITSNFLRQIKIWTTRCSTTIIFLESFKDMFTSCELRIEQDIIFSIGFHDFEIWGIIAPTRAIINFNEGQITYTFQSLNYILYLKRVSCGYGYTANLKFVKVDWNNIITSFTIPMDYKIHFPTKILFFILLNKQNFLTIFFVRDTIIVLRIIAVFTDTPLTANKNIIFVTVCVCDWLQICYCGCGLWMFLIFNECWSVTNISNRFFPIWHLP